MWTAVDLSILSIGAELIDSQNRAIKPPDFRNTDGCVDAESGTRTPRHVNFNRQVRRGVDRQIDLGLLPDEGLVFEIKTFVGLEPAFQVFTVTGHISTSAKI